VRPADATQPEDGADHASSYVGLTSVLNVVGKAAGTLALTADRSHTSGTFGFQAGWQLAAEQDEWRTRWSKVEDYLERIIPAAAVKHATREGAVQAAVSSFTTGSRVMLDREVALHFKDADAKKWIFDEVTAPIRMRWTP